MPFDARLAAIGVDRTTFDPKSPTEKLAEISEKLHLEKPRPADDEPTRAKILARNLRKLGLSRPNAVLIPKTNQLLNASNFDLDQAAGVGGKSGSKRVPATNGFAESFFDPDNDNMRLSELDCTFGDLRGKLGIEEQDLFDELGCTEAEFEKASNALYFQFKFPGTNEGKGVKAKLKYAKTKWKQFIKTKKADVSESENIGEYIAGLIYQKIAEIDVDDPDNVQYKDELAPRIYLVYDDEGYVCIVSKYLRNAQDLDNAIIDENKRGEQHVKIVSGQPELKSGFDAKGRYCYSIDGDNPKRLNKQDLADQIVASIIFADHDINPQNQMIAEKEVAGVKYKKFIRIDFGHPFCEMILGGNAFLKGKKVKDNYVIDYFNRGGIAFGQQSKFWRDYPGMIPSQEILNSLHKYHDAASDYTNAVAEGITEAKEGLTALIDKLFEELAALDPEDKNNKKKIERLKKSIKASTQAFVDIANNFLSNDEKIKLKDADFASIDTVKDIMEGALDKIEEFCTKNIEAMDKAIEIMQLQVDVDNYLNGKEGQNGITPDLASLKAQYDQLVENRANETVAILGAKGKKLTVEQQVEIREKIREEGIEWIKSEKSSENKGFKCNLAEYVGKRKAFLEKSKPVEAVPAPAVPAPAPHLNAHENRVLCLMNRNLTQAKDSKKDSKAHKTELDDQLTQVFYGKVDNKATEMSKDNKELVELDHAMKLAAEQSRVNRAAEAFKKSSEEFRNADRLSMIGAELKYLGKDDKGFHRFSIVKIHAGGSLDQYNKSNKHNPIKEKDLVLVKAASEKAAVCKIRNEGIKLDGKDVKIEKKHIERFKNKINPFRDNDHVEKRNVKADIKPAIMTKFLDPSGAISYKLDDFGQAAPLVAAAGRSVVI